MQAWGWCSFLRDDAFLFLGNHVLSYLCHFGSWGPMRYTFSCTYSLQVSPKVALLEACIRACNAFCKQCSLSYNLCTLDIMLLPVGKAVTRCLGFMRSKLKGHNSYILVLGFAWSAEKNLRPLLLVSITSLQTRSKYASSVSLRMGMNRRMLERGDVNGSNGIYLGQRFRLCIGLISTKV